MSNAESQERMKEIKKTHCLAAQGEQLLIFNNMPFLSFFSSSYIIILFIIKRKVEMLSLFYYVSYTILRFFTTIVFCNLSELPVSIKSILFYPHPIEKKPKA